MGIIFWLIAILCALRLTAQELNPQTELWGYELTFYQVTIDTVCATFYQGDTLTISWTAPTERMPYDTQPDMTLSGLWSGLYLRVLVQNSEVNYGEDSELRRHVWLASGFWELTIRAIDLEENYSKESEPFVMQVKAVAPGRPADINVIVRK